MYLNDGLRNKTKKKREKNARTAFLFQDERD